MTSVLSARVLAVMAFACLGGGVVLAADDAALFTNGPVSKLKIIIPAENIAKLRDNPRQYIRATVRAGTNVWRDVGVHIKGSIGSFRSIDGKPSLTLSFEKFVPEQRFHGLRKIHLNNSVEDGSYMHEMLGNELFRAAGLPAPRVTHAMVEINERRVGLYVLKEGFTEEFLARYFRRPEGNLYDISREAHDVNEPLAKDMGRGPDDHSDLKRRWEQLPGVLDLDRFLSFMAMEILVGHRDGYCLARNNFRVYHDVDSNRFLFFPHGMDVLFGNARAPVQPLMNGLVARGVLEVPEGRSAYRRRCALLFTNVLTSTRTDAIIDAALPPLRAALNTTEAAALEREIRSLRQRIADRVADVDRQLKQAPLQPLPFRDGVATVTGWRPVDVPEGGSLTRTSVEGKAVLAITAGPVTSASWRSKVLLPPGRYRFDASVKTLKVEGLPFGKNHGVALKVSGAAEANRSVPLLGDKSWTTLTADFAVKEREQEVELICELRARRGEAWIDADSVRVFRVE